MSLLNVSIFQKLILRNSNGGAQPNIGETDILRISIPLLPFEKKKLQTLEKKPNNSKTRQKNS